MDARFLRFLVNQDNPSKSDLNALTKQVVKIRVQRPINHEGRSCVITRIWRILETLKRLWVHFVLSQVFRSFENDRHYCNKFHIFNSPHATNSFSTKDCMINTQRILFGMR